MTARERAEYAFKAVEQSRQAVDAFTGIKRSFMDAGWSEAGAEQMVIALLMKGGEQG